MRTATSLLTVALFLITATAHAQADKSGDKVAPATPDAVLEASFEASGGAAWATIVSLQSEGVRVMDSPMGGGKQTSEFVETLRFPGYAHAERQMDTPMGAITVTQVSTPDGSWAEAGDMMPRRDTPLRTGQRLRLAAASEEWTILNDDAYQLVGMEEGVFEGTPVYTVTVEHEGTESQRHYSQETLLLVGIERRGGEEPARYVYSDYREVDGVMLPFARTEDVTVRAVMRSGSGEETESTHQVESAVTIERYTLNPDVDDALFAGE